MSRTKAGSLKIGKFSVNRLGLGTNRITDTQESYSVLREAVKLGVNFIDTAHRYGGGASEIGIGNALRPYPENLVIATKGGYDYDSENGSPEALARDLSDSLARLKTGSISLYQLHCVDPKVPIEESVGALKKFMSEGKIAAIGLSNVNLEQLKRAQKVAPIASVQNRYNVTFRDNEDVLDFCTEQSIAFLPWFPLGGSKGGKGTIEGAISSIAGKYDATPEQIAIAWLLKRSPIMLPIPGTLSLKHLKDNLAAGSIELSEQDFNYLSNLDLS